MRGGRGLVGWGRGRRDPHLRRHPLRRRRQVVGARRPRGPSSATRSVSPAAGWSAFGSFAFADEPGESVLLVPEVVVGRRGESTWVTTVGAGPGPAPTLTVASPPEAPREVVFADGALNGEQWMTAVADAVARIDAGDLEKVVLARDLLAAAAGPIDVRWPLERLATDYSELLDVPRRRDARRHARDAGPPRARPGHLPRAGRHHPTHRRRRARPGAGGDAGAVVEGPRGARVRRPVGRRGSRAPLLVDERARGAVRAAPAQRDAPGHRRGRGGPRRRDRLLPRARRPRCTRRPRSAAPPPRSRRR